MKKTVLATLATVGLATGAFAQGAFSIDNSSTTYAIAVDTAGSYYTGTAGLQVWELNGNTFDLTKINSLNNVDAYTALTANGFTLQKTFTGVNVSAGSISLNQLNMPAPVVGPNVTLAFAMWTGAGSDYTSAAKSGVLAFYQPVVDFTATPAPTAKDLSASPNGFNAKDLVMVAPVPEPGSFALLGLGAAAMMIFRRRK
jgi:hypothetical protein